MEKVILYIQLLYDENETIRRDSELQLNSIFRNISNIPLGFQQLYTLEQSPQLKFFIYLKNFLHQNFEFTPMYIQKQLQFIIWDEVIQFSYLKGPIVSLFCELYVQIAAQALPGIHLLQKLVEIPKFDEIHIKLLTAILQNRFLIYKMRTFNQFQDKILHYFNPMNLHTLQILSDLYLVLSKSIHKQIILPQNDLQNQLINQFQQVLILNGFEYSILKNFAKSIYKVCLIRKPSAEIVDSLFQLLVNNYMQSEKQRITDRYYAYLILKLLKKMDIYDRIQLEKIIQEQIIVFTMINLLMLEKDEYFRISQDLNEEDEPDYFLEKIRKFTASFLFYISGIFEENFVFSKILCLQDILSKDQKHEIFECIKKEAHYYLLNQLLYLMPVNYIDQLSVQELIMILQQQNPVYIPLKMQVLSLVKKLLMKNMIDPSQHNYIIRTVYEQISTKLIKYPIYLCKNVEILIYMHQKYQNQITIQTYFELKELFLIQKRLLHKETILMTMAEIDAFDLGDLSLIQIINDEWNIGLREKNKYKYQLKMILNVLFYIMEIFPIQKVNIIAFGILKIAQSCLEISQHQQKSIELLNALIRKFTSQMIIKNDALQNQMKVLQALIHQKLDNEPELFRQVVLFYYLILMHDVANYDLAFQFIQTEQVIKNHLQLLQVLLYNLKNGQYIELIQSLYTKLLKDFIYDEGKTYSELICGLSILDLNGYDVKEFLVQIEKNIPEKMLNVMVFKGTNYIRTYNQYYYNYLINYFNCIINKQNIQFDLEQLTLEINENTFNLQQHVQDVCQILKPNKFTFAHYLQKIFESQFLLRIQFCESLMQKYNLLEFQQIDELDMQKLIIQ